MAFGVAEALEVGDGTELSWELKLTNLIDDREMSCFLLSVPCLFLRASPLCLLDFEERECDRLQCRSARFSADWFSICCCMPLLIFIDTPLCMLLSIGSPEDLPLLIIPGTGAILSRCGARSEFRLFLWLICSSIFMRRWMSCLRLSFHSCFALSE